MKRSSLPALDARYWAAILAASLVGTTLGDYISQTLHLGYFKGLVPLGFLLAATFLAERKSKAPSEVYYWMAIVITRTGATNVADLATHQLKLDYRATALCLALLMIITLLCFPPRLSSTAETPHEGELGSKRLPAADTRYWTAIMIASILGTTLGDFVTDGLGFGVGKGSLLLDAILAIIFGVQRLKVISYKPAYWVTIVAARTAGTAMGDFMSGADGLNLGFLRSALCAGLLLLAILNGFRSKNNSTKSV